MKSGGQSFSFVMELIIVIFFFALSSCVCVLFIGGAKEKENQARVIQDALLQGQTIIETMQANPQSDISDLFDVKEISDNIYQINNINIKIIEEKTIHGIMIISYRGTIIKEIPFVVGELNNG